MQDVQKSNQKLPKSIVALKGQKHHCLRKYPEKEKHKIQQKLNKTQQR